MAEAYKGAIFDIDGVLEFQDQVMQGALETLAWLRKRQVRLRFLSNSTLKSRAAAAERLRQRGFQVFDGEMVTASYATAHYLRSLQPMTCWVMLDGSGLDEFAEFEQNTENPDYVVIGDFRNHFNFQNMNKALRLLNNGASLIGMIPEILDLSQGGLELNVGAWVRMLEDALGKPATYIGKPHPYGFELSLASIGLPRQQVVMVGDQVDTDIKGAQAVGLKTILLTTGEYALHHMDGAVQADHVFGSIEEIVSLF
ncbi:MAG: HAD-IIA family hydrolase [Anaerolineales bacterium]|nr:HAD-IIA family hydrolase [Anaerolineales bacterium]